MNIRDVLYMRNTGKLRSRASIQDKFLARKLSGGGVITTATGNPVSIVTNKAQNTISTILSYSPKQSGSGTPSPTNIRPIEGWTEANLGVNSETPTKTISLGGTYYGFTVDLENGTATIRKLIYTFNGSENWRIAATGTNRIFRFDGAFHPSILRTRDNTYICNMARLTKHINNIENLNASHWFFRTTDNASSNYRLLVGTSTDDVDMTLEAFKAMLANTPMVIVADIETPQTIALTPQTVALLKGANTLWTDGDSLSVTYLAKK